MQTGSDSFNSVVCSRARARARVRDGVSSPAADCRRVLLTRFVSELVCYFGRQALGGDSVVIFVVCVDNSIFVCTL